MKKNKWFITAALIGLVMSASFVIVSCGRPGEVFCDFMCSDCHYSP
jgi:hypothetical protein